MQTDPKIVEKGRKSLVFTSKKLAGGLLGLPYPRRSTPRGQGD